MGLADADGRGSETGWAHRPSYGQPSWRSGGGQGRDGCRAEMHRLWKASARVDELTMTEPGTEAARTRPHKLQFDSASNAAMRARTTSNS